MKKTENFPYIIFVGATKKSLYPTVACPTEEEALHKAKSLAVLGKVNADYKCVEVIYMPEDVDDINEVVWTNCGRK